MNTEITDLRNNLLEFWSGQLKFDQIDNAIHIAYPLLMPDGWQVAFSLYTDEAKIGKTYRLSDNGKASLFLKDYRVSGHKVSQFIESKCEFFGIQYNGCEFYRIFTKLPSAIEVELFAEGIQAIAYLIYRSDEHHAHIEVARENFEKIIAVNKFSTRKNAVLQGRVVDEVKLDYVIDSIYPLACKISEKKTDIYNYMEIWAFRFEQIKQFNSDVKTMMIYNPDVGKWDDKSLRIGDSVCDMFTPYYDTKNIVNFINNKVA